MKELFKHLFLPHHSNNQRAKLLHHSSIFFVVGFLILQTAFITSIKHHYPQVLGTAFNISSQDLLLLTNQKRADAGVGPLVLNTQLSQAAKEKAAYMIKLNYWAHNAPDGITPWDFIKNAGYTYIYAGENLARGFTTTPDVIEAWMASPDHRENMLSSNYQDVGFAVMQGDLTGEKDTVLIVEEFGNTTTVPVAKIQKTGVQKTVLNGNTKTALVASAFKSQPFIDSNALVKNISLFFVISFILVLVLDILIVKRKKVVRIFEHNIDHIMFIATIGMIVLLLSRGSIS